MDCTERLAAKALGHLGFTLVEFEPRGNVPPDFLIENRVAVEVRLLNQNIAIGKKRQGLEELAIPLIKNFEKLLKQFGPSMNGFTFFISFSFYRPLPPWKILKKSIKSKLQDLIDGVASEYDNEFVVEGLKIDAHKTYSKFADYFLLGGLCDLDEGGFVLAELEENIVYCAESKWQKVASVKHLYSEWWLIFINEIGLDHRGKVFDTLEKIIWANHDWAKIIIVDPIDTTKIIEFCRPNSQSSDLREKLPLNS